MLMAANKTRVEYGNGGELLVHVGQDDSVAVCGKLSAMFKDCEGMTDIDEFHATAMWRQCHECFLRLTDALNRDRY